MRWDQIRSGLLAGPMVPNSTTDLRPLFGRPETPRADEALVEAPQGIMSMPGSTDFMAQTLTRGAMSPPKSQIELGQTPLMRDALDELSGLVQGRGMGRMVSGKDVYDPVEPSDDLPDLPSRGAAGPLRNMRTTDPNMRDLFKDWF